MEAAQRETKPIEILFSYAREDEELRNKLEIHLASLKRQGRIICWHDRHIRAGDVWRLEVTTHLETANIILFLVSADFVDSRYCNRVEVRRAMERHEKGEVWVVPVILRQCDWEEENYAKFHALPLDARPVAAWPDPDAALYSVAKGLKEVIVELEKARASS